MTLSIIAAICLIIFLIDRASPDIENYIRKNPKKFLDAPDYEAYQKGYTFDPDRIGKGDTYVDKEKNMAYKKWEKAKLTAMNDKAQKNEESNWIDSPYLVAYLIGQFNDAIKSKFNYELTEEESCAIFLVVNNMSKSDINEIGRFIIDHPFVTAYMVDRFIEIYETKRQNGERIDGVDIAALVMCARMFQ